MSIINTTNSFSGHSNRGLQIASNSGQVFVNLHGQTETSPTKPEPSSTVPFRQDPDFVDRGILTEIGEKCSKPASRVALVGLGGVGKSQLAIEYSYRIREQFPQTWIFWVHANNAARFEEGYRIIADRIKLPRLDEPMANILQLVSNWLCDEANGRWIMILDNADDSTVFSDPRNGRLKSDTSGLSGGAVSLSTFLPQTPNGSILVTSRSEEAALRLTGRYHDMIKVEPMHEGHALLLFGKKLYGGFDESDAIELVSALDYMPLAISQAAAYINQRAPRTTVARYLIDFRKSDRNRANLLNRDAGDLRRDSQASNSIIATWQISFEHIRSQRPSAACLLSLMSFFDRQGIPEFLLHDYDVKDESSDIDLENDSGMNFEDDLSTLISYSLIVTNVNDDLLEMHRLVQFSTRKWLELSGELEKWKKKYIRILSDAFPVGKYENWKICQMLYPHAEIILTYRPAEMNHLVYWSDVLENAGWYAAEQGNYLSAEEMNEQALEGREKALGKEHPKTLTSVSNLALVMFHLGKYKLAEEMNRRVLGGYEKTLGKEHYVTLTSARNLSLMLQELGQYEAAEEMIRRALNGYEETLGKEHPATLSSVSILGTVLRGQGKYGAAEEICRRALDGRENALGMEHPYTLESVIELVLVMRLLGKYEEAEEMNRRALEGRERLLGKEHPDTLTSVSILGMVLQDLGKYEAAEEMNRRALKGLEKALGKEHPFVLTCISDLALLLQEQGKHEAAEKMNRQALDGYEKTLGKEHPYTLTSVKNLALLLQDLGNFKAEEKMNRRALEGMESALGKEHPETLTSVYHLAYLLHQRKQYKDATPLYERSHSGFQKVLGINHPTYIACFGHYSSMIEEMNSHRGSS